MKIASYGFSRATKTENSFRNMWLKKGVTGWFSVQHKYRKLTQYTLHVLCWGKAQCSHEKGSNYSQQMRQGDEVFVDLKCKNDPRVSSPLLHCLSFSWEGPTPVMLSPQFQVSNPIYVAWEPQETKCYWLTKFSKFSLQIPQALLFFYSTTLWSDVEDCTGYWAFK